jgi:hypothetical protein
MNKFFEYVGMASCAWFVFRLLYWRRKCHQWRAMQMRTPHHTCVRDYAA